MNEYICLLVILGVYNFQVNKGDNKNTVEHIDNKISLLAGSKHSNYFAIHSKHIKRKENINKYNCIICCTEIALTVKFQNIFCALLVDTGTVKPVWLSNPVSPACENITAFTWKFNALP